MGDVDQLNEAIRKVGKPEMTPKIMSVPSNDEMKESELEDTDLLDSSLAALDAEKAELEAELAKLNRQASVAREPDKVSSDSNPATITRSNGKRVPNKRVTLTVQQHHAVTVTSGSSADTTDVEIAADTTDVDVTAGVGGATPWDEFCPLELARLCENPPGQNAVLPLADQVVNADSLARDVAQPLTHNVRDFIEALVCGSDGLAVIGQQLLTLLRENIARDGSFEEYRAAAFAKVFNMPIAGVPDSPHVLHSALSFLFYNAPRMQELDSARTPSMSVGYVPNVSAVFVGSTLADVD